MIKEKAELDDIEITAPSVWLAEKIGKSQAWLSLIKRGEGNPRLSKKTKKLIIKYEAEWKTMKVDNAELPVVFRLSRTYKGLSENGKRMFLKEIKK